MLSSNMDVLIIGAIMALATVATTAITVFAAAARQKADWKRQDQLDERQAAKTQILIESNQKIADEAANTSQAITAVHELAVSTHAKVNSALTAIMQSVLDGLLRELALMRRIPKISTEEVEILEAKIAEKRAEMESRTRDEGQI